MSISLSNSTDIIANSISLLRGNSIEDISTIFLSKDEALTGIVGLPVETLNTLQKISEAVDSDPNYFSNNQIRLNLKANTTYVNNQLLLKKDILSYNAEQDIMTNRFSSFQSIASNDILLNAKANQTTTYTKTQVDGLLENLIDSAPIALNQLSELAAALNNDANYASNVNNLIATKAAQATTYTKTQTDTLVSQKANQSTTYNKSEVDGLITSQDWLTQNGGYNEIDSNVGGLIIKSNNDTAVQVLGSSNTGAEGSVLFYKNVTILGEATARKLTVTFDVKCRDLECSSIYGPVINQLKFNLNPFHCAGRINGEGTSILQSKGKYNFTFTKTSADYYLITFDVDHPDGANFIVFVHGEGYPKSGWNVISSANLPLANTPNSIVIIQRDNVFTQVNSICNFCVLA